ncbi:protein fem-1 homolog B [Condylostylus longicornis]|uniref:protein fem-1 homolog B n=1 Tax=Condylostylus longicornis TaxID=2530218 RepID=UPI00244E3B2E|nr:protein fem-1 homolog B [Condylostylus longicornis]
MFEECPSFLENINANIRESVYFAAKDGHPLRLLTILNSIENPEAKNFVINQLYEEEDGQIFTPLVVAATFGKYLLVKSLLASYKVDLEKECTVKFDGHIVSGVTALWCAAGAGHINIVKLLIRYGANVNHKTESHSTPLRISCFVGRLDIVRYLIKHNAEVNSTNTYNNTCLMISAYKGVSDIVEFLLSSGADPNLQALCGATALHYAAECGHTHVCRVLLEYGAKLLPNEHGLSAALTAADRTHEDVVNMFCEWPNLLSREEKIDVYELMGASFANDKDNYSISKSHKYLSMGMQLRYENPEKIIKKKLTRPILAYDDWIESQNPQELQAIRLNYNSIHMESLTIRERILSKKYPDLPQAIIFRGAIYADQRIFDKCEKLWFYALQLRKDNKISIERDLLRFAQLYSQILHLGLQFNFTHILDLIEANIDELEQNRIRILNPDPKYDPAMLAEEYEQNIITALYLLTIVAKTLRRKTSTLSVEDLNKLYNLILKINKINPKLKDGQSLLHLAVNSITPVDDFHTSDVCRFPSLDTVKLLLHCGASIATVDCDKDTPLHTLVMTMLHVTDELVETVEKIIKIFNEAGIHFDAVNKHGLTAAEYSLDKSIKHLLKHYEAQHISLKCLSSRCIAKHKLKYEGSIPVHLESYIKMHSKE